MRFTYGLELAYDGTGFYGWQSQPHGNTVQDYVEKTLAQTLALNVRLVPASRTDTGVHAEQQYAIFRVPDALEWTDAVIPVLNATLPRSIRVKSVFIPALGFHPRVHAKAKVYCYRLLRDSRPTSDLSARHWRIYRPLNVALLRSELQALVGRNDFSSYCASGTSVKSKVRTISSIDVIERGDEVELWFTGEGFLKQMIRIIVGSAVPFACGSPGASDLKTILAARNRLLAGKTAPAQGLTLHRVVY